MLIPLTFSQFVSIIQTKYFTVHTTLVFVVINKYRFEFWSARKSICFFFSLSNIDRKKYSALLLYYVIKTLMQLNHKCVYTNTKINLNHHQFHPIKHQMRWNYSLDRNKKIKYYINKDYNISMFIKILN